MSVDVTILARLTTVFAKPEQFPSRRDFCYSLVLDAAL
jgi:hypothetical protein